MSVIKIKARVRLISEQEMDIDNQYDMGNVSKDVKFGWRSMGIPTDQIYKIIAHSKTKSLIIMHDEEKILVNEPFSELFKRWRELVSTKTAEEEINKIAEDETSDEEED